VVFSASCLELSAQNFNHICLNLTFYYCTMSKGLIFSRHSVYSQVGYNPQASARRPDDLI